MISAARTTRPSVDEALFRERLFQVIDPEQLKGALISGQPGAGKTTLAAAYAQRASLPCIWLSCDETDADPASFVLHFSAACAAAGVIDATTALPALKREHLANLAGFARFYFRAVFAAVGRPVLIVLDDLHVLSDDDTAQTLVATLLRETPAGVKTLLTSRKPAPACFARALINGTLAELRNDDLLLTEQEIAALLTRRGAGPGADKLYRLTGGWAAAVALFARHNGAERWPRSTTRPERLDQYFASEVLAALEPALCEALLRTAWLSSFTPAMAEQLTGRADTAGALQQLAHDALFVYHHPDADGCFRYHPLFAGFLRAQAEQTLPPAELTELQRCSARLLEQHGDPDTAFSLWLRVGASAEAAALVLRHAKPFAIGARFRTLNRWLEALAATPTSAETASWMAYWRGVCALQTDPGQARRHLISAGEAFAAAGNLDGRLRALAELVASYFLENANSDAFRELLREVETLSAGFDRLDDVNLRALVGLSVWMGVCLNRPDYPERERWERRLQQLLHLPVDPTLKVRIGMVLTKHYYFTGQYHHIWPLRDLLRGDVHAPGREVTPYGYLLWHLIDMAAAWTQGDFATTDAAHAAAIDYAERTGVRVLDNFLHSYAVVGRLLDGRLDDAAHLFTIMGDNIASASPMAVWNVFFLKAWHAALGDHNRQALDYATVALRAAQRMDSVPFQGLARVALAHAELARGTTQAAAGHRIELQTLIGRGGGPLLLFQAKLIDCALHRARGDCDRHLAALREALALGREQQFTQFMWALPRFLGEVCAAGLAAAIETDYVNTLVRERRLAVPTVRAADQPATFRFFTFGGLRVEVNGRPLRIADRGRPAVLLKCLLALGGQDVPKHRLADLLWPDADGDDAQHALENLTYRLRKQLGNKRVVRITDGRYSLDPALCWVDAWELRQALRTTSNGQAPHRDGNGADPLALYRGPFLADDDEPWLLAARDELQRLVLGYRRRQGHADQEVVPSQVPLH